MSQNPRKKPKLVKLPDVMRSIFVFEECDVTFHFKDGSPATNAMVNWIIDRIKLAVHS